MKKILFLVLFLYFLVLIQTTFLNYFDLEGLTPNLLLIAVIFLNLLQEQKDFSGIFLSGIGGFFLDLFSGFHFGVFTITLFILSFLIKKLLGVLRKENIVYFIPVFIFAFIFYDVFSFLFNSLFNLSFPQFLSFGGVKLLEILYNLTLAILVFFLIKICFQKILEK